MNVYLVMHDDGIDAGYSVLGIYATRELAEASRVTRTPSGARSRAYCAHDEHCCDIEEYEVRTEAATDIQPDPEPYTGPQQYLIPNALVETIVGGSIGPNPYRNTMR